MLKGEKILRISILYAFKLFITVFFLLPANNSCNNSNDKSIILTQKDKYIYDNCIRYIIDSENFKHYSGNNSFVICPYFRYFSFDMFSSNSLSDLRSNFLKEDEEKINKKYFNKKCYYFNRLYRNNKGNLVISFSGHDSNFVIGYFQLNDTTLSQKDLNKGCELGLEQVWFYLFNINEQGEIINCIEDSVHY